MYSTPFSWKEVVTSALLFKILMQNLILCFSDFNLFTASLSGGHVVGNFSPYEAFAVGGTNSVRGYEEGGVGSGRSYVVGSGEISFPVVLEFYLVFSGSISLPFPVCLCANPNFQDAASTWLFLKFVAELSDFSEIAVMSFKVLKKSINLEGIYFQVQRKGKK